MFAFERHHYDMETQWTRFRAVALLRFLFSQGWTEQAIHEKLRENRERCRTVLGWLNDDHVPAWAGVVGRIDENVVPFFRLPLWRLLSPKRLSPREVDQLMAPLLNKKKSGQYHFGSWDVDRRHGAIRPKHLKDSRTLFFRGGLEAFTALLALVRQPKRFKRKKTYDEAVANLYRAIPSACRTPWLKGMEDHIVRAITRLFDSPQLGNAKPAFGVSADILKSQIASKAFDPARVYWDDGQPDGPVWLADPIIPPEHLSQRSTGERTVAEWAAEDVACSNKTSFNRMAEFREMAAEFGLPRCEWEGVLACDSDLIRGMMSGAARMPARVAERCQEFIRTAWALCHWDMELSPEDRWYSAENFRTLSGYTLFELIIRERYRDARLALENENIFLLATWRDIRPFAAD